MSPLHLARLAHAVLHSQDGKKVIEAVEQTAKAAAEAVKSAVTGK
jgi:hypothetical protein